MKDNWFGEWLDIDIIEKGKYAVQIKREKSLREKKWEMAVKGDSKERSQCKKDDPLATYEEKKA